ncbi:hypothetical protein [Kocuria arenosa]|uniref:hypothetical protein n=1 Tax=Kocuria arenosa TaxID=3071446 RepID=UPI0034D68AE3
MRSMHRLISTAFGPRAHSSAPSRATTTRTTADSRPYGTAGRLVSSPWEGLYLEFDG